MNNYIGTGLDLLKKLASIWTQFYTSILPTLQAIFAPIQVSTVYNILLHNTYIVCMKFSGSV